MTGRFRTVRNWTLAVVFSGLVVGGAMVAFWLWRYAPAVQRLARGVGDTVFLDAEGRPWFRLDEQRHDVPLAQIATDFQHAVVAIEDRRFWQHRGIDPIGVARAVARDIRAGGRVEGGSTLTQQLARILFLSNAKTFGRKAQEATIALLMERQLTKEQILELYLNRVYLSAGVYGVEAMSEHLFRKPAQTLSLPEAAFIAGLIRAPSALSPWQASSYDKALERSRIVLAAMHREGFITEQQVADARLVRPRVQPFRQPGDSRAAWAKDFLRQQFRAEFGGDHPPDWQVRTTFVPELQDGAERAVASGLARLNHPDVQAALVAIDPSTGDLLAMVGGGDYRRSTYNRATRGRRQPGSAFKPFVYAAALSNGYSPVSVLSHLDNVHVPGDADWSPRNASAGSQPTELTLRAALLESNNAAAADLQQQIGVQAVLHVAGDAGLSGLPDVPSLALGTGLVSPLELTTAYTMFPGGGEVARPRGMIQVLDANHAEVFQQPVERTHVMSPEAAFQMVSMLRDVVDRGTGSAARALGVQGPVGGKTGTTDQYRDAWFVGFSSSVVVGVWVGLDQPAPIGPDAYGARVALPIWADFMTRAARRLPAHEFPVPSGVRVEELCSVSYLRPVAGCPVYREYFKSGDAVPTASCTIHEGASVTQRAARFVGGFLRRLGSAIAGLFGRR